MKYLLATLMRKVAFFGFLVVLTHASSGAAESLVLNGGFETGDLSGWGQLAGTNAAVVSGADLPFGWQDTDSSGNPVNYPSNSGYFINDPSTHFSPYSGAYMLALGSHTAETNWQVDNRVFQNDIPITSRNLLMTFAYNMWSYDYGDFDSFTLRVNGIEAVNFNAGYVSPDFEPPTLNYSGWQLFSLNLAPYIGEGATSFRFTFRAGETGDTAMRTRTGVFLDQVGVFYVPEPGTLALLGLGLAGLGLSRRRKAN